ncbi:MAG TPA: hypothetical protein VKN76_12580, partial [Kiloniellaceae bacterium]|nr:hypothetical protein [Kiloniellaceae bacterium]
LKDGINEWLARDGGSTLTSQMDTFIYNAEAVFNRMGVANQWYQMEEETSLTTDSDGNATLPADFLAVKSVRRAGSPNIELDPISMGTENRLSPDDTAGVARFFSISGTTLRVTPIEAGTDLLTLTYFEKIPNLAANTTNWLLTLAPDAYLFESLAQAQMFTRQFEAAAGFHGQAMLILDGIGMVSTMARYGNAGIVNTDVPIA